MQIQMAAHRQKRDVNQFKKALTIFNKINLKTAYKDNGLIVVAYVGKAFWCFDLLLVDEGFQLISKIISIDITSHQLTAVRSTT